MIAIKNLCLIGALSLFSMQGFAQSVGELPGPGIMSSSKLQSLSAIERLQKFLPLITEANFKSNKVLFETARTISIKAIYELNADKFGLLIDIVKMQGIANNLASLQTQTAAANRLVAISNTEKMILSLNAEFLTADFYEKYNQQGGLYSIFKNHVSEMITKQERMSSTAVAALLKSESETVRRTIASNLLRFLVDDKVLESALSMMTEDFLKRDEGSYQDIRKQLVVHIVKMSSKQYAKYRLAMMDSWSPSVQYTAHYRQIKAMTPEQVLVEAQVRVTEKYYEGNKYLFTLYRDSALEAIEKVDDLDLLLQMTQVSASESIRNAAAARIASL